MMQTELSERAEVLRISDLRIGFSSFDGPLDVIDSIDLNVYRGEKVAIVGESGCGKSITARAILGLLDGARSRVDGSIRFASTELVRLGERRWRSIRGRKISMIFQDPSAALNPVFKISDQLTSVAIRGGTARTRAEAIERSIRILDEVLIAEPDRVLNSYPFQLSGGMNQRVLIAMALINGPELILADEPGTALDVTVQEQTLRLMDKLTTELNSSVLIITHNLGVVRNFAERVYVMYAGQIAEHGTVADVFESPKHPYTRALLESVPRLSSPELPAGIEGNIPDYVSPPTGCRFRPRCPFAREACAKPVEPRRVSDGHEVSCVLYDGEGTAR